MFYVILFLAYKKKRYVNNLILKVRMPEWFLPAHFFWTSCPSLTCCFKYFRWNYFVSNHLKIIRSLFFFADTFFLPTHFIRVKDHRRKGGGKKHVPKSGWERGYTSVPSLTPPTPPPHPSFPTTTTTSPTEWREVSEMGHDRPRQQACSCSAALWPARGALEPGRGARVTG